MLMLTVWVTLVTLPLIWVYFGELPLLSIPTNLLIVPLVTGYLYLTGLTLILSPLISTPETLMTGPSCVISISSSFTQESPIGLGL